MDPGYDRDGAASKPNRVVVGNVEFIDALARLRHRVVAEFFRLLVELDDRVVICVSHPDIIFIIRPCVVRLSPVVRNLVFGELARPRIQAA